MITLSLTPAEHAFLLLRLGRGTGSTIRPGESLSAQQELELVERVAGAGEGWLPIESAPLERPVLVINMDDARQIRKMLADHPDRDNSRYRQTGISIAIKDEHGWGLNECGSYADGADLYAEPTHWQPLPATT